KILSKNPLARKNPFSYLLRRSGRKQSGTSYQVKDPDASIRGIKLAAMQASGYQTPAAGLRSTPVGAVCHWHTAPPNGHASMSACLVARVNKKLFYSCIFLAVYI